MWKPDSRSYFMGAGTMFIVSLAGELLVEPNGGGWWNLAYLGALVVSGIGWALVSIVSFRQFMHKGGFNIEVQALPFHREQAEELGRIIGQYVEDNTYQMKKNLTDAGICDGSC